MFNYTKKAKTSVIYNRLLYIIKFLIMKNNNNWIPIVVAIITAIGSTAVWQIIPDLLKREDEKNLRQDIIYGKHYNELLSQINTYTNTNTTLMTQLSEALDRVDELETEVNKLKLELARYQLSQTDKDAKQILEKIIQSLPWPSWLHEVGKNRWYLNNAYNESFNIPSHSFWDHVNILATYPSQIAAHYVQNDMKVIEAGIPMYFEEPISRKVMEPISKLNPSKQWDITKTPIKLQGSVYVWGQAFDKSESSKNYADYLKQN